MSVTLGNSWDRTHETATDQPGDRLPEGSQPFSLGSYVNLGSSWDRTHENFLGISAEGLVHRDYSFVSGVVGLYYNGKLSNSISLSNASYALVTLPPGIESGETQNSGSNYVQFLAEDGSVAEKELSGNNTNFRVALKELSVEVRTVDGSLASEETVVVDNKGFTTDSDGKVVVGSSGTPTIVVPRANLSKDADLSSGNDTVAFTFSGAEGKVRTPSGSGIANAKVSLETDTSVIAETITDTNGEYKFDRVPVDKSLGVVSEPFSRTFVTGSEGQSILKNLPFQTDDVAAVDLTLIDQESGDPIASLPASIKDSLFAALSTGEGVASIIANVPNGQTEEKEVILGQDDPRYKSTRAKITVIGGESVELRVELERKPVVTNV